MKPWICIRFPRKIILERWKWMVHHQLKWTCSPRVIYVWCFTLKWIQMNLMVEKDSAIEEPFSNSFYICQCIRTTVTQSLRLGGIFSTLFIVLIFDFLLFKIERACSALWLIWIFSFHNILMRYFIFKPKQFSPSPLNGYSKKSYLKTWWAVCEILNF